MKIFIDIGHPAHVHYFRNFIKIMKAKGHSFFITARSKEVTHELLNYYNIPFLSRGSGRRGFIGKAFYVLEADFMLYKAAKKYNPDLFLSFGSAYAAHVSKLFKKVHIAFDDTDHAKYEHLLYVPFTDYIYTPKFYNKNFGNKHKRFNGLMELCYLHPNYCNLTRDISSRKYILFRLINWDASHDFGYGPESRNDLINFILELSKKYEIIISSEGALPDKLVKFKYSGKSFEFHEYLSKSLLCISEGGTVANESALLGIPNIIINPISKTVGVHQYLNKLELQYYFDSFILAKEKIISFIENIESTNETFITRSIKFINESVDITTLLVEIVNISNTNK